MTLLVLGIDGGGSGCRAAVAGATGAILGRGSAGPANINSDAATAADNLRIAADAALAAAGTRAAGIAATVMGLAGAGIASAVARVTPFLNFPGLVIVNDAVTASAGALGGHDGMVVAVGTGSVIAVQRAGQPLQQYGGRGFLLGDEGCGAVLGRALLALSLRAADGFVPMTPLLAEMLDRFGSIEGTIEFAGRARPADFAALAPRIAGSDDPAARQVMRVEGDRLGDMIDHLQARGDAPLPVVFTGGLGPAYARHFDGRWPMQAPRGDGVDGALLLARRQIGAAE